MWIRSKFFSPHSGSRNFRPEFPQICEYVNGTSQIDSVDENFLKLFNKNSSIYLPKIDFLEK